MSRQNDVPLACDLTALDAASRARHAEVSRRLFAAVRRAEPLPDGYTLHLPPDSDTLLLAAEFITRERLCCPFFRFALILEPGSEFLSLCLTGGAGVREFVRQEMGL